MNLCCWIVILTYLQVFVASAGGDRMHCLLWPGSRLQVPVVGWTGIGVHPSRSFNYSVEKCNHKLLLYTQYWSISTPYHSMFYKTTTFAWKGALATMQYSTCDTVMWYNTLDTVWVESSRHTCFPVGMCLLWIKTVKQLRLGWTLSPASPSQAMLNDMVHLSCSYVIQNKVLAWPLGPCPPLYLPSFSGSSSGCLHAYEVLKMAELGPFCSWLIGG